MRRIVIVLSLVGAIVTSGLAYGLLRPAGAYAKYYQAHEVLERLAFGGSGSEELKKAVTDERLAMKAISVSRGLARGLIGGSILFVGLAVFAAAFPSRMKEPIQPPQRNAGRRPSSNDSPASDTPSSLGPRG